MVCDPVVWESVVVSLTGTGHEKTGMPCQDTARIVHLGPSCCVIVVADGAGSARQSELGSRCVVESVFSYLVASGRDGQELPSTPEQWQETLAQCAVSARDALERLASTEQFRLRDLSTTLLVLALDTRGAVSINVGDCAGIVADANGELHLIAPPAHGEYVNQTYFLTDADWMENLRFNHIDCRLEYGFAFSDSLEYVALHRGVPFSGFTDGVVGQLRKLDRNDRKDALEAFLRNHVAGKRTDDDISLAVAWPSAKEDATNALHQVRRLLRNGARRRGGRRRRRP